MYTINDLQLMSEIASETRILQKDGLVFYVSNYGEIIPLIKLAGESGYRIDVLCNSLDISPRHFRRLFVSSLGICPKKWLKSERMVFARNLLRSGIPIKKVSEKLGFSAQKEFYREFKDYYNTSPSDFRTQETERVMERLGWAV